MRRAFCGLPLSLQWGGPSAMDCINAANACIVGGFRSWLCDGRTFRARSGKCFPSGKGKVLPSAGCSGWLRARGQEGCADRDGEESEDDGERDNGADLDPARGEDLDGGEEKDGGQEASRRVAR